jgi:hypothetical protein
MKKELRIFFIIIFGWIFLLDFAILKTQINNYINTQSSIIVKNVISGAAVYYPLDNHSVLSGLVLPLIVYNALIIIFLSISYYFWIKSKNKIIKTRSYNKKGQAAMEFMMTYGWAIMALVISFAALYSFGVILKSPNQDMCALSPGIGCKEFIVGNNGVSIILSNGLGNNLNNVLVNITNVSGTNCVQSTPKSINDGRENNFGISCVGLKSGDKFKGTISITYLKEGNTLTSTSVGAINSKVMNNNITLDIIGDTQSPVAGVSSITPATVSSGNTVIFNTSWTDNINLSTYILSINQTGLYINQSIQTFTGTSAVSSKSLTITASGGTTVYWFFIANDTSGNMKAGTVNSFVVSTPYSCKGTPSYTSCNQAADDEDTCILIPGCDYGFILVNGHWSLTCYGTPTYLSCTPINNQVTCELVSGCSWS